MPFLPVADHIRINDPDDGAAIARAMDSVYSEKTEAVIARVVDGECVGGAIYDGFTRTAIGCHMAGLRRGWINRDLLWVCFHYPFVQLGVKKMVGKVQASNEAARKLNEHLGFTVETTIRDMYPDGDMLIYSMYKADCRWLAVQPRGPLRAYSAGGQTDGEA